MIRLFYVYILKCSDETMYTGYTVDLEKRVKTHNSGLASKYTRGRLPVSLVYHETCTSKSGAMKREIEIKKLNRNEKLNLIEDKR